MKQNAGWALIRLVITLVMATGAASCLPAVLQKSETITLAVPALEQNALIYIADQQGFFKQNGLQVTIRDYDTGVTSMKALLEDKADLAVAAEFPVVRSILKKDPVSVLASIDRFENNAVIARKDRGITQIADLKGKRIGVAPQTISEFFLGRFLELNHIRREDVTLVDLKPGEFAGTISGGKVDALIAWQPYVHQIETEVDGVLVWPAQSSQFVYGLLVCRTGWLTDHPDTVERVLKSLLAAENYLVQNPTEAAAVVQKRLKYDDAYMSTIWPQHQFALTLDYSLMVAMTGEARWLMKNHLISETQIPDFFHSIYLDALKTVKAQGVDIHR